MNAVVQEWLDKSDHDREAMTTLRAAGSDALLEAACFHAQQCVEKLMKAVLIAADADAPKTHNLILLNERIKQVHAGWDWPIGELDDLTRASVQLRYPGLTASKAEADAAADICERVCPPLLALILN